MQTKRQSLVEASTSVAIGYVIMTFAQILIYPRYGMVVELSDHLQIGLIFTSISLTKGYLVRRLFNRFNKG